MASQTLMSALGQNKEKIENEIPWIDLEDSARIERLRKYTKQTLLEYARALERAFDTLESRIRRLESHKHDASGTPIIEERLNAPRTLPGNVEHDLEIKNEVVDSPSSYI